MSDYTPIVDELSEIAAELAEVGEDTFEAIKAGRRNNGSDQAQIDKGYEMAMQLCDLFESLGADTGEEDGEEEDDADMEDMEMMGEGKAIAKREDVNPKEGLSSYGDVAFADAKNKKYPIDTPDHIRAAWNYINKADNAAKYDPDEVKQIKAKIVAAWRKKIDDAGPPSAETKKDAEYIIDGDAVKALPDGRIGAYAIRFGSEDEPDMSQMRDYFTAKTDFWIDAWDKRPMLYHHAMDEDTDDAPRIGTWVKAEVKDEGIWLEGQLDRHHRYHSAIKELIKRGALRLSSDSAPHLVRRATKAAGVHEVTRWPIIACSLTPTPAEPRLSTVSFKTLLDELGPIEDEPEPEVKADEDKSRRLLLELELLELEQVGL